MKLTSDNYSFNCGEYSITFHKSLLEDDRDIGDHPCSINMKNEDLLRQGIDPTTYYVRIRTDEDIDISSFKHIAYVEESNKIGLKYLCTREDKLTYLAGVFGILENICGDDCLKGRKEAIYIFFSLENDGLMRSHRDVIY